ncbi:unnamed protein product [Cladocopium goreaui]|uniref:Uncharacterized protein n=1 Tax=Cladocopium goreaui TaxID=2562237 RepID=A0A9P1BKM2_9DINO|nr:unnamed protein product [Cladocopium goreaui]
MASSSPSQLLQACRRLGLVPEDLQHHAPKRIRSFESFFIPGDLKEKHQLRFEHYEKKRKERFSQVLAERAKVIAENAKKGDLPGAQSAQFLSMLESLFEKEAKRMEIDMKGQLRQHSSLVKENEEQIRKEGQLQEKMLQVDKKREIVMQKQDERGKMSRELLDKKILQNKELMQKLEKEHEEKQANYAKEMLAEEERIQRFVEERKVMNLEKTAVFRERVAQMKEKTELLQEERRLEGEKRLQDIEVRIDNVSRRREEEQKQRQLRSEEQHLHLMDVREAKSRIDRVDGYRRQELRDQIHMLTALLVPDRGHGDISVSITASFSGDDVCSFLLPAGSLADLERVLRDLHGPMFRCRPWSRVLFYTEEEPSKALGLQLQLGTFASLVIKHGDLEAWLFTFPDTGKFLEAMQGDRFDPRSPNFQVAWTAGSAPPLLADKAECLVHEVLSGSPIHADSGQHFVQIFGKLTSLGEQWNNLNLRLLQNLTLDLKATPILLLKRNHRGYVVGCSVIGDAFPSNFGRSLRNSLLLCDVAPRFRWSEVSRALLSLDWNPQEGVASLQNLMKKIALEPCEFAALQHQEVSQLVQVQLRLSCCGVAKVKGSINEASVKILAELLAYRLKILKFQGVPDLMSQMNDFECNVERIETLLALKDQLLDQRKGRNTKVESTRGSRGLCLREIQPGPGTYEAPPTCLHELPAARIGKSKVPGLVDTAIQGTRHNPAPGSYDTILLSKGDKLNQPSGGEFNKRNRDSFLDECIRLKNDIPAPGRYDLKSVLEKGAVRMSRERIVDENLDKHSAKRYPSWARPTTDTPGPAGYSVDDYTRKEVWF